MRDALWRVLRSLLDMLVLYQFRPTESEDFFRANKARAKAGDDDPLAAHIKHQLEAKIPTKSTKTGR